MKFRLGSGCGMRPHGNPGGAASKGQTSMIAIAIAVVMLVLIMIFMLSSALSSQAGQSTRSEYRNLFAHNALISVLRTDTECGILSDVLKGGYFGGGRCDSRKFVESRIPAYMGLLLNATGHTDYEWFLEASPMNFRGEVLAIGSAAVKEAAERWDARTIVTWEGYQLEVKLYFKIK